MFHDGISGDQGLQVAWCSLGGGVLGVGDVDLLVHLEGVVMIRSVRPGHRHAQVTGGITIEIAGIKMDGHIHGVHLTLRIESRVVLEIHELTPSHHLQIVRPLVLNLDGSASLVGGDGAGRSHWCLSGELPAEPTTGAWHADTNVVGGDAEDTRQNSLGEVAILVRHHQLPDVPVNLASHTALRLHVKVLLRPRLQRALSRQRRVRSGRGVLHGYTAGYIGPGLAAPWWGGDRGGQVFGLAGVAQATCGVHVGDDVALSIALLDLLGAGASLSPGVSHHNSQQHSNSRNGIPSFEEQLLLQVVPTQHRTQIVHSGHIRRSHKVPHAWQLQSFGGVHCQELCVGRSGEHHLSKESARSTVRGVGRLATGLNSRSQLRNVLGDWTLLGVGAPALRPRRHGPIMHRNEINQRTAELVWHLCLGGQERFVEETLGKVLTILHAVAGIL
mmetsp:Transcript_35092/g.80348  ORF Transcript_35092/g.80348 Transcript_35092/m.80348 type:complete len:444 (+) Transcript_35092:1247-2578(+)